MLSSACSQGGLAQPSAMLFSVYAVVSWRQHPPPLPFWHPPLHHRLTWHETYFGTFALMAFARATYSISPPELVGSAARTASMRRARSAALMFSMMLVVGL